MHRGDPKSISVAKQEISKFSLADTGRVLQHCLENRLQFTRRTADDLEHVGSGGLLLQGLAHLAEQARGLDGDRGLVCEALDQLYLPVGELADLLAADNKSARQLAVPQHRHA